MKHSENRPYTQQQQIFLQKTMDACSFVLLVIYVFDLVYLHLSGVANIRLVDPETKIKGYDWVGWRNDTTNGDGPVEITFEFEDTRNFTSVTINSNNYFMKNIRAFKNAMVFFSVGGKFYLNNPVKYALDRVIYANFYLV